MLGDQTILFLLLGGVFALLIWGRVRYDLVAFGALVLAVLVGVVPEDRAFEGFSHPATVIIALVLVVSKGMSNSGAVELIAKLVVNARRSLMMHITVISSVSAALSAVMNNVTALTLLMPIDMQAASKARRSPALTLMPLSFASILGGLITLIGTPPNIIISSIREEALGEPFGMFDFSPVGVVVAIFGVLFIAGVGWRLIPRHDEQNSAGKELSLLHEYIAEVRVGEKSVVIDRKVRDLDTVVEDADVAIIGLSRRGKRLPGLARREVIAAGDMLIIQASAESIDGFVGEFGLEYVGSEKHDSMIGEDLSLIEVVVPEGARIEGRSALQLGLLSRHAVTLLGVSRQGRAFRTSVRKLTIRAGDVLLMLGLSDRLSDVAAWLGTLPLQERDLQVIQRHKAGLASAAFCIAIVAVTLGMIQLPVALAAVCIVLVASRIVPLRDLYTSVEWPVIVLLGALIPIGSALNQSGGTESIAGLIVGLSEQHGPVFVMTFLMLVTMTLSDALDNAATTVIAAPIAIDVANRLGVNPDPFLMAVAVAASCAFLTPIGHKNNTLIMGPGGYRFGDYWRMGLPLEILVIAVSVPMIIWVWPFYG